MALPRLMAWGNFVLRSIFSSKSKFTNRVVLITGGGQGIGKLMACKLHSVGAKVVVWDNNPKLLATLGIRNVDAVWFSDLIYNRSLLLI